MDWRDAFSFKKSWLEFRDATRQDGGRGSDGLGAAVILLGSPMLAGWLMINQASVLLVAACFLWTAGYGGWFFGHGHGETDGQMHTSRTRERAGPGSNDVDDGRGEGRADPEGWRLVASTIGAPLLGAFLWQIDAPSLISGACFLWASGYVGWRLGRNAGFVAVVRRH